MDFRKDLSVPGIAPYQSTVANYTDNYILLVSSSKSFSYAGQRIGMMIISDALYDRDYENLKNYYGKSNFGFALVLGTLYGTTAGVTHSAQYGLAALLKAVNDGKYNFLSDLKIYGEKAKMLKKIFLENGFNIVYDRDLDEPIADGFYFTVSYPNFSGNELVKEFLYYGISAFSLSTTGSEKIEGIRICTSLISIDEIAIFEERLKLFKDNNPN